MNLTCLGIAMAAAFTPNLNMIPQTCPAEIEATATKHAKTQISETRRFPSLTIGERIPETPLESMRRLIAIRNAEQSLESLPAIELVSETKDAEDEDKLVERAIEILASVEPMPPEAEIAPEPPRFVTGDESVRSRWTEPMDIAALLAANSSEIAAAVEQIVVASLKRGYEDELPLPPAIADNVRKEVQVTSTDSQDQETEEAPTAVTSVELELAATQPILPELAEEEAVVSNLDPFTNGKFDCLETPKKQPIEVADAVLDTITEETVKVTTDSYVSTCETEFFDDEFEEEEEMIEHERIALEAAIKTLR